MTQAETLELIRAQIRFARLTSRLALTYEQQALQWPAFRDAYLVEATRLRSDAIWLIQSARHELDMGVRA